MEKQISIVFTIPELERLVSFINHRSRVAEEPALISAYNKLCDEVDELAAEDAGRKTDPFKPIESIHMKPRGDAA